MTMAGRSGSAAACAPGWRAVSNRPGYSVVFIAYPTTVTVPLVPSTSTTAPLGIRVVQSPAETTQGMPSSRLTMAAWENGEPTWTTTAAAATNSGVHDGSVIGATSTSPASSWEGSDGSSTTRATPRARPGQPGTPVIDWPGPSTGAVAAAERRFHSDSGAGVPSTTNGGSRS